MLHLCITPLNMTSILKIINDGPLSRKVKFILMVLALVNSGLNPIVYVIKMKSFRDLVSRNRDTCVAICRS